MAKTLARPERDDVIVELVALFHEGVMRCDLSRAVGKLRVWERGRTPSAGDIEPVLDALTAAGWLERAAVEAEVASGPSSSGSWSTGGWSGFRATASTARSPWTGCRGSSRRVAGRRRPPRRPVRRPRLVLASALVESPRISTTRLGCAEEHPEHSAPDAMTP